MNKAQNTSVAVVGLGYVGLPLALLAEKKGFEVVGIEASKEKVSDLKNGVSLVDDEMVVKKLPTTKILFTDQFSKISDCDIVIICVPTPVDGTKDPDLSLVESAVKSSVAQMKQGSLLVVESTINPGVCDEVVIPLIEFSSNHVVGKTIHLAHCPERINPGDKKWNVGNINRVLGASDQAGLDAAYSFYSKLVDADIMKMNTIKEAEAVKVVENSFRDINIAFVNELAMSFKKLGIDVTNVINGAATKPFAFMAHYPGIGVGGHCIPVDPYYLMKYAMSNGFDHKFLRLARDINESMPVYSVGLLEQALIEKMNKPLSETTVCVLGLSYKPNVADDRESPAYAVISALEDRGATVVKYDPYFLEKSTEKTLDASLAGADAAILVTSHDEFKSIKPEKLGTVKVFFDGRNLLKENFSSTSREVVYTSISSAVS